MQTLKQSLYPYDAKDKTLANPEHVEQYIVSSLCERGGDGTVRDITQREIDVMAYMVGGLYMGGNGHKGLRALAVAKNTASYSQNARLVAEAVMVDSGIVDQAFKKELDRVSSANTLGEYDVRRSMQKAFRAQCKEDDLSPVASLKSLFGVQARREERINAVLDLPEGVEFGPGYWDEIQQEKQERQAGYFRDFPGGSSRGQSGNNGPGGMAF